MSDIIQILPDSVANQIAAGEVIQRPASVIKELVENAIDAGATRIDVLITDAGRTAIQVIDNGRGMSPTDARLAFERHATSKIRQAADLFALHTMGFRGEALPSIVAVAQVDLRTRRADDQLGTHLQMEASRYLSQEPCNCAVGSSFTVKNLFFNVPARRKFLKSNATEMNNIVSAFQRIVLVYPAIQFTLHSNNTEMMHLRSGTLRQRIVDVFGKRINQDLLPVNVDTTMCRISGFVGKPESARKKGAHQYFFVNGRYMKHPYFHRAVQTAVERLVPSGEQIPYFIYFEVNPDELDVNIHPTKTEIKFENEQTIWQILLAAVKEAIGLFREVPTLDFDAEGRPDIPVYNPSQPQAASPKVDYNPNYNPFRQTSSPRQPSVPGQWDELYAVIKPQQTSQAELFDELQSQEQSAESTPLQEKSPLHYQFKGQYIITSVKSGLMIVDQHRAHTRILYDEYLRRLNAQAGLSQRLLYPEVVQLTSRQAIILQQLQPDLEAIGFDLSDLGAFNYSINALPAGLEGASGASLLTTITDSWEQQEQAPADLLASRHHAIALQVARHAAIPYGQVLSNDEMENLINSLFACPNLNYSPTGKPIVSILRQQELDKMFN